MNTLLSIDFGSRNMHLAEGTSNKGRLTVRKCSTFPMPDGCMKGETVVNPQVLAEAVRNAIRAGGFHAKEVTVTMNAGFAMVRDIDLPIAKPKELESMIRNEMVQYFHVSSNDILQYKVIEQTRSSDGEAMTRYRVASIDKDIVDSYYAVLELVKLKIIAMDINLNAMDKLLTGVLSLNDRIIGEEAVMLIDYGRSGTTLYIAARDKPLFFRRLNIGSEEIENTLSDALQLSAGEIRELKESGHSFFDESEGPSYYTALKPLFYRFNDEIRKIISFYNSRAGISAIGHVYLFGGGSGLAGLPEYWAANLGLPVDTIRSIDRVGMTDAQLLDAACINAVGALFRY